MHHQTAQSAIRLEVGVTQADDQLAQTGLDDNQVLNRLPQADSSKDGQVHNEADEIEPSSKEIRQDDNQVGNLEDGHSIKATAKTLNTGGQPQNLETDVGKVKENKGSNKHMRRKSKVTFAQLLEKYQRISEAKSAHRPADAKASKSSPGRNSEKPDWRKKQLDMPNPRTLFGPPMPKSSMPSQVGFYSYPSRDRYDSLAHHPSYTKSSRQLYTAPRGTN